MDNKNFKSIRLIIKTLILLLWVMVFFAVITIITKNSILEYLTYFFGAVNGILLLILIILGSRYVLLMEKTYKNSKHYKTTKKGYFDIKRKQRVVFNVSNELLKYYDLDIEYSFDRDDHLYFEKDGIGYSVLIKEYNGDLFSNPSALEWQVGYKKRKDNTYFNKINVPNPYHQNKRIMDKHYLSKGIEIKNIIIVSDKTDKNPLQRDMLYLEEFIKRLKK
ncbi:hypothetical protein CI105_06830 [Candidatus Izimaplasma bacterium ZiA1]|uniref:hypothetical protein n=1 Tax=Candidatus Izimoplasma sp. ZiA1 TaxID=2024899 RepID=UPI000BAA75D2|nr:hypothetical protein CI105_06830 [Candidatus Izimaplasma bacterium ZiA1]